MGSMALKEHSGWFERFLSEAFVSRYEHRGIVLLHLLVGFGCALVAANVSILQLDALDVRYASVLTPPAFPPVLWNAAVMSFYAQLCLVAAAVITPIIFRRGWIGVGVVFYIVVDQLLRHWMNVY